MLTLYAVPPAGGTAAVYRPLAAALAGVVDVRPIELPGRGSRSRERPYPSIAEGAKDVAQTILADPATSDWGLLGHSMGALIAYEAMRRLADSEKSAGSGLFLSGCPAPNLGFGPAWAPDMTAEDILSFLLDIANLPPAIAHDEDARQYFVDLVRHDESLIAGYQFRPLARRLTVPVTVIWSDADPVTRGHDPSAWAEAVGGAVTVRLVSGASHSLLTERTAECASIISSHRAERNGALMSDASTELYLDLMKRVLTNIVYEDPPLPSSWLPGTDFDRIDRQTGLDWPSQAHTMIGLRRLDNVQDCVERILGDKVEGDFIETGVWRGGTCIFLRALLRAHGVTDRLVWCADSFEGMPEVQASGHAGDVRLGTHKFNDVLGVPLDTVKRNFEAYGLLDEQVRFVPGWFKDTLPSVPIRKLALLRLDGDLYESTMDALVCLYPKLSVGGFVIVDDYLIDVCREAVTDFRARHGISDPIEDIDGYGVFWRRTR